MYEHLLYLLTALGAWLYWFAWSVIGVVDWALRITFITKVLRIMWRQEFPKERPAARAVEPEILRISER
jgi:hypothetical protein